MIDVYRAEVSYWRLVDVIGYIPQTLTLTLNVAHQSLAAIVNGALLEKWKRDSSVQDCDEDEQRKTSGKDSGCDSD